MRKVFAGLATLLMVASASARADDWDEVIVRARGQSVYWHAWAGDPNVNAFIAWTAGEVKKRFGIELHHVKLANTADAVSLLVAEKAAGRTKDGRVDLIWLNGENFAALKQQGLLYGPFVPRLPNFAFVDTLNKPTTVSDFTVPTEGFESPWGMAQIVFFAAAKIEPPRSMAALKSWAAAHPGRFTYPAPPDFTGTTFLKQALLELTPDRAAVYAPVTDEAFARVTAPLWAFTDALHPTLWRKGTVFPANYPALRQLMNDGEIDIGFSFNPADASSGVAQKLLPPGVRPFVFEGGTIGNTHFVAIPATAAAKEGAMVVANFLLSPEAQARKADPKLWGDPTVLDVAKLDATDRQRFAALSAANMLTPEELRRVLPEPHPSWVKRIEQEWQRRYSR
jgi:putative thiamine transport system substrate-binding protein